jgi:DNA polymerase V
MFALVDCNNFYASCERVFNPALNGRPIVILSNNDGCVIARSNEAKALGIEMGAVAHLIKAAIEKHKIVVFSSNYTLYGDMSGRVMTELNQFTPNLEIYSIDEAFLDLSGMKNLDDYGRKIKQIVTKNTGIPISVGIAPTKALSKIANRIAKKSETAGGVLVLDSPQKIEEALKNTKVGDIWGVGRKYAKLLQANFIETAFDFINTHDLFIQKHMKVNGIRLKRELMGESCIPLETMQADKKAICTSRSFGEMLSNFDLIEEAVATFASRCAAKLRRQKTVAKSVMVFIYTNPFLANEPQYNRSVLVQLPVASNSSIEIIKAAQIGLRKIFKAGFKFKKAGVIVSEIVPEKNVQIAFFDETDHQKHRQIMQTMDDLNADMGREKVKISTQGTGRKWRLRQEKISKCYTTKLDETIIIGR